jgi:predicted transcriptional regulator
MFVPCEFAVRLILPTARAFLAKELAHTYQLRQSEIASLLHVTQSAVSQYLRNKRGHTLPVEPSQRLTPIIADFAHGLITHSLTPRELVQRYCRVCHMIRAQKWLCARHKILDPTITEETCTICLSTACFASPRA